MVIGCRKTLFSIGISLGAAALCGDYLRYTLQLETRGLMELEYGNGILSMLSIGMIDGQKSELLEE
jgi:hypothetical protein